MEIRCPYCDRAVTVPGGGQFTCPSCRAVFAVDVAPPQEAPPPVPGGMPAPAAPSFEPAPRAPNEVESAPTISTPPPLPAPDVPPPGAVEPPPLPTFGSVPKPVPAPGAGPAAPDAPPCALHPDRKAVDTCRRCATFTCDLCVQKHEGEVFCPRCIDRAASLVGIHGVPWEAERERIGVFSAFFRTLKAILFEPSRFFEGMPRSTGLGAAVVFYVISAGFCGSISTAMGVAMQLANPELMKLQAQIYQKLGLVPPSEAQTILGAVIAVPLCMAFLAAAGRRRSSSRAPWPCPADPGIVRGDARAHGSRVRSCGRSGMSS
ncbi:hypothetical protein HY251_06290 [bacterium]|nr:hypothetical protein [bacterium]